jgi:Lipid-A-disaccharide synthetase
MTDLIVTVNAPGEVAGWLLPLVDHVKAVDPRVHIRAVLTPCPFAGGREREILSAHPALDEVVELGPFLRRLLRRRLRPGRGPEREPARRDALILHLGGDRLYSLLIARMLGAPAWVYGTSRQWSRRYARCLVPNARAGEKLARAGVRADRIATVGEMVVDSVPADLDVPAVVGGLGIDPERDEIVSLMAGSRPYEVNFMLPFYADLVDDLAGRRPSVRCLLPFSEFVEPELLSHALARAGIHVEGGGTPQRVRTRNGAVAHIVRAERYSAMAASRLVVTLPGTNTLQLAALGTPMVVVVPLNEVENAVVEGPINWLSTRWRVTRALKRRLLLRVNRHIGFIALPNILAGREVVPELRKVLQPGDVGGHVVALLDDHPRRQAMSRELRDLAGPRGAAARLAAELLRAGTPCACGS